MRGIHTFVGYVIHIANMNRRSSSLGMLQVVQDSLFTLKRYHSYVRNVINVVALSNGKYVCAVTVASVQDVYHASRSYARNVQGGATDVIDGYMTMDLTKEEGVTHVKWKSVQRASRIVLTIQTILNCVKYVTKITNEGIWKSQNRIYLRMSASCLYKKDR